MRFKLVPAAPDTLDVVADAQRAVPLVPVPEDEVTERLMRRVGFRSRDVARTWLTFLRALELVAETDSGFRRRAVDPTPDHLRTAFRDRVFLAAELLDILRTADDPVTVDAAFDRLESNVPTWEHYKNPTEWRDLWRNRVGDLFEWCVRLDLATPADGEGYVAGDAA